MIQEYPIKLQNLHPGAKVIVWNVPRKFSQKKIDKYTIDGKVITTITRITPHCVSTDGFGDFRPSDGWAKSYKHNPTKPFHIVSLETKKIPIWI